MNDTDTNGYVLGHSDGELARLEYQAEIFRADTEEILAHAGLTPGMRILDIGCGVGDVALAAARKVGPHGEVIGIDTAGSALSLARARAEAAGLSQVTFVEADIADFEPAPNSFDALVGRFILMHLQDPVSDLARLMAGIRPGGVVAAIELDVGQAAAEPPLPLLDTCLTWITRTYEKVGVEANMGSKLYSVFRAVGLTPRLRGFSRIEGGPDSATYQFAAETLRTMAPAMEEHGIATREEVDVDTIAERLREAAVAGDHCIFFPRIVGAWARAPQT